MSQLKAIGGGGSSSGADESASVSTKTTKDDGAQWELTDEDKALLARWVNPTYLGAGAAASVSAKFEGESSAQLKDFLRADVAHGVATVLGEAERCAAMNGSGRGAQGDQGAFCGEGWRLRGPAHVQRYLEHVPEEARLDKGPGGDREQSGEMESAAKEMRTIASELFESPAFRKLLHALCGGARPTEARKGGEDGTDARRPQVRFFRRGQGYTVAHHGMLLSAADGARLDATLCFCDDGGAGAGPEWIGHKRRDGGGGGEGEGGGNGNKEGEKGKGGEEEKQEQEEESPGEPHAGYKREEWESGEVGGFHCYIEAEDEAEEAAEVYQGAQQISDDDGGILLSVSPSFNTLSLALRDEGVMVGSWRDARVADLLLLLLMLSSFPSSFLPSFLSFFLSFFLLSFFASFDAAIRQVRLESSTERTMGRRSKLRSRV